MSLKGAAEEKKKKKKLRQRGKLRIGGSAPATPDPKTPSLLVGIFGCRMKHGKKNTLRGWSTLSRVQLAQDPLWVPTFRTYRAGMSLGRCKDTTFFRNKQIS